MCAQRNNSSASARLLTLDFQLVDSNVSRSLTNDVKQTGRTSKDLQYNIWSQSVQRFSRYETT
jgi:hypothetical protein